MSRIEITGQQLNTLRKRLMIAQGCVYAAIEALNECGNDGDGEALAYAFGDLRAELEKDIPGISPTNMPEPEWRNN